MPLYSPSLCTFCLQISHQKVPRHVIFVESFPLTPVGKVKKYALREIAVEKLGL
jgi:fatty-acyl-CoA synthase